MRMTQALSRTYAQALTASLISFGCILGGRACKHSATATSSKALLYDSRERCPQAWARTNHDSGRTWLRLLISRAKKLVRCEARPIDTAGHGRRRRRLRYLRSVAPPARLNFSISSRLVSLTDPALLLESDLELVGY